jgi:hypothetical protein
MARNIDEKQREGKTKWLILFGIVLISSIAFFCENKILGSSPYTMDQEGEFCK